MSETAAEPSSTFRPTLFHIALIIPWVALVVGALERIWDNSYLWHIRAGSVQVESVAVLTSDTFSFTRFGDTWRTQSWLAELGYGWLERVTGLSFTGVMVLFFGVMTMVGIGVLAWRYSRSIPATSIVVLLSSVVLPQFLVPRPALFSFPIFLMVILAWDRPAQRWMVPLLFWIWASVHGSFAIGVIYVLLRIVQKREWVALRTAIVSGSACLVTAHGLGVLSILWDFVEARPYLALISEWQTPDLLEPTMAPVVVAVLVVIYGAAKGRLGPDSLWIIGPFLVLAVSAERAVGPAWLALVPAVAMSLGDLKVTWARGFRLPIAWAFGVVIILLPFLFTEPAELDEEQFPVAASEALADVPTFHDDYTGGYLIWRWGPEKLVYIDDRAELYQEQISESLDIRSGRLDWREPFDRYGIEQVLLLESDALADILRAEGWATVYSDDRYLVMRPDA